MLRCQHVFPSLQEIKNINIWYRNLCESPLVPQQLETNAQVVYQKGKPSATRDLFCVARGVVRVVQANGDSSLPRSGLG